MAKIKLYFLTLFPDQLKPFFCKGIIQRGIDSGLIQAHFINIRDFAINKYGQVDDIPYGGRRGMLLRVDVLDAALRCIPDYQRGIIYYTCPKGRHLSQNMANEVASEIEDRPLIILSGYYEGVDDRIFDLFPIQRFSLGDVILSSGDAAAVALAESVTRLIPGVIGDPNCITEDSYVSGYLEHPQYSAPRVFKNIHVPDILLSGHHQKIASWKRKQSLGNTLRYKPELLINATVSSEDRRLLTEFLKE